MRHYPLSTFHYQLQGGRPFAEGFSSTVALPQGNSAPVFGWQSDSKPLSNTNCQPKTESELPCGNVMFRRNITHQIDIDVSRLAPVFGRQLDFQIAKTDKTGALAMWSFR
ncbi:MAG: hypothetical protein LBI18_16065 [Planctomycetaceae bacterium]|jgi:hypothetical protein|nr:hypothetical protein [Planctomycetaceae bacterium]